MITPVSALDASALPARATPDPKLATAARQFETVLLGQWLQEAKSSFASVPGGDGDTDAGGEQMQSFATQQLATSFAAKGGVGIAKLALGALAKANSKDHVADGTPATLSGTNSMPDMTNAMAAYKAEVTR